MVPKNEKVDLSDLADKWPSTVVARPKVGEFSGWMVTPGHVANCDSAGTGPEGSFMMAGKRCYRVKSFIAWLEQRVNASPQTPEPVKRCKKADKRSA